ncbi:myb/SANT-like DNA-binding domain-containing protein 3 isoform X2 [Eriocheir sinensis]|uniref:myb/SANT-like DNA-binding domain-containing protein 3 isoform X2 n=1 Tax=Eriocheir sinensis TaxID=95602 RepID=UPI0021C806CD|nr:myb/SANT-like DNA-binding domain-containing protein 3 isoform X2 [Eriocheir sinensis]
MAEGGEGAGRRKWFIPLEKTVLTALVEQHKGVVESKKRDGTSNREKEKAWEGIAAQFSAHPATQARTSRELRRCWENMKARNKKGDRATQEGSEDSYSAPSTITPDVEAVFSVLNPYCLIPETPTDSHIRMQSYQAGHSSVSGTSENCEATSHCEKLTADLTPNIGPSKRTRKQKMDQLCNDDILLAQMQMQQAQLSIENLQLERKFLQERCQQQREAHEWQRAQHEVNLNLAMLQIKYWEKKTGYVDMET